MTEADSMTVGGRKCGAVLRQDPSRRCQRPAGWGTEHPGWARCKLHGGASPGGRKAAAREMAHAMMPTLGRDLEIEPTDALLPVVHREAGRLAWLREEIELLGPGGDVTDKGSLLSVLAKMEAECCERLARFSKMALVCGVAERRVRMVERQAEALAHAFTTALDQHPIAAEMTVAQRAELVRLFAAQLALLESGGGEVEGQAREVG